MHTSKALSRAFLVLALLLSHVMCAAAAYGYCNLQWRIRYYGASAPAHAAFLIVIPYGIGIALCAALARFFARRAGSSGAV